MEIIRLENVRLVRSGRIILNDINWNVSYGEHWGIIGANGSGKTTLMKIITGYQWPTSGTVRVLGKKFGETNINELRKEIGWVSSDLHTRFLQNISVLDTVVSGYSASIGLYQKPTKEVIKKAKKLMKFTNIDSLENRLFPLLSYGQQKKALIARALMHDPKLLILDEPCTSLDLPAREQFLSFLEDLAKKKKTTLCIVTHYIEEIIPSITDILFLKGGKVFNNGKKDDIMTSDIVSKTLGVSIDIECYKKRYKATVH